MGYNEGRHKKRKKIGKYKILLGIILICAMAFLGVYKVNSINKEKAEPGLEENIILNNEENNIVSMNNISENKQENIVNTNESFISNKEEPSKTVNDDYFGDAIFIGDSRTEGFILNNGLTGKITEFTHKGLTVDTIFTDKVINMNGKKVTIMEALKETNFSKVYIMLGINETGWVYSNMFINKYEKVIDEIIKINPKCKIYVESIIPVSEKVSNEHKYINNTKIQEYNSLIKKMAEEKNIYYLNVQEAVVNKNGVLPGEASSDGIHLNKKYCKKWFEYLKNNVIGE